MTRIERDLLLMVARLVLRMAKMNIGPESRIAADALAARIKSTEEEST